MTTPAPLPGASAARRALFRPPVQLVQQAPIAVPAATARASLFKRTGPDVVGPAEYSFSPPPEQPEPARVRVAGVVSRVIWQDEALNEYILWVKTSEGDIKLRGFASCQITVGSPVVAESCTLEPYNGGVDHLASVIHKDTPLDHLGMIAYLSQSLDGIGKGLAARIVDLFGDDTYHVLDNEPELLLEVEGIAKPRLDLILASRKSEGHLRDIWTALAPHGIGGAAPMRILNKFGGQSLDVIRRYPYRLADVPGIGFKTADSLAQAFGGAADSTERIEAAMGHVFTRDVEKQGHTAIPLTDLLVSVQALTGLPEGGPIQAALDRLVEADRLRLRTLGGRTTVSTRHQVNIERDIAAHLLRINAACRVSPLLSELAGEMAAPLKDAAQISAVQQVYLHGVSVITGGPGCGKTTVTRVLAEVAVRSGLKVVMCGPTNKSARRITEATGMPAGTMHALLGTARPEVRAVTKSMWQHYEGNPLKGDLFCLDEISMADAAVSRAFLAAVPSGARIVLIGDSHQLASVGAGNVLHDIISSGCIPAARLSTPHRTARDSDIVMNSYKVTEGDADGVSFTGTKDFKFTVARTDPDVLAGILDAYARMADLYGHANVQVLVSMYKGPVGVNALNKAIRRLANPPGPGGATVTMAGVVWRHGDRVVCSTPVKNKNGGAARVTNGEVGIITGINQEDKTVLVLFGDRPVLALRKSEMACLDLGYVITTHKSQGSEYKGVVLGMPRSHQFMFNRNLFHTGMTRGKSEVVVVGCPQAVRAAIRKPGAERCTGLTHEILAVFRPTLEVAPEAQERPPVQRGRRGPS